MIAPLPPASPAVHRFHGLDPGLDDSGVATMSGFAKFRITDTYRQGFDHLGRHFRRVISAEVGNSRPSLGDGTMMRYLLPDIVFPRPR